MEGSEKRSQRPRRHQVCWVAGEEGGDGAGRMAEAPEAEC